MSNYKYKDSEGEVLPNYLEQHPEEFYFTLDNHDDEGGVYIVHKDFWHNENYIDSVHFTDYSRPEWMVDNDIHEEMEAWFFAGDPFEGTDRPKKWYREVLTYAGLTELVGVL